jgi:RNA polymerase sigma factor (sigma-70 family)
MHRNSLKALDPGPAKRVASMFDKTPTRDAEPTPAVKAMWTVAYRKYFGLWTNLAKTSGLSDDESKDVVQSIITGILCEPKREFESLDHVRNYVAKSVFNRVKVVRARNGKKTAWQEDTEIRFAIHPDEYSGDEVKLRESLCAAMRGLSRKDFSILKMRFFSGFTLAQVGEFLDMPISTVKSREDAILRKIRKKLHRSGF